MTDFSEVTIDVVLSAMLSLDLNLSCRVESLTTDDSLTVEGLAQAIALHALSLGALALLSNEDADEVRRRGRAVQRILAERYPQENPFPRLHALRP